eukprot:m.76035 g.76035  ORF g.76035 m.76035 type:complete len:402 (+) comp9035_c0_seq2:81-1286(+)
MAGFGPARRSGGTRGGQDQFKWTDVKTDKHRENYLGASLYAAHGRWQKNKDLQWFARGKSTDEGAAAAKTDLQREIDELKQAENDALAAALGFTVEQRHAEVGKARVSKDEFDEATRRGQALPGVQDDSAGPNVLEADRIQGIGYSSAKAKGKMRIEFDSTGNEVKHAPFTNTQLAEAAAKPASLPVDGIASWARGRTRTVDAAPPSTAPTSTTTATMGADGVPPPPSHSPSSAPPRTAALSGDAHRESKDDASRAKKDKKRKREKKDKKHKKEKKHKRDKKHKKDSRHDSASEHGSDASDNDDKRAVAPYVHRGSSHNRHDRDPDPARHDRRRDRDAPRHDDDNRDRRDHSDQNSRDRDRDRDRDRRDDHRHRHRHRHDTRDASPSPTHARDDYHRRNRD